MTSNPSEENNTIKYDPNNLLDTVISHLELRNDAALSRILGVEAPVISKIRHRRVPVGASLLIRIHEVTEISIQDLRALMGDQRKCFRIGYSKKDKELFRNGEHEPAT
jgi:hypothetical protein